MKIDYIKCHGTGNDFILIDEYQNNYNFTEKDRQNIAIKLCDREHSIGADGILFVLKSDSCDGRMRIFNSDGTEPEMCGNGLRCVGRYLMEILNKDTITVQTFNAKYLVNKEDSLFNGVYTVKIKIDTVNFEPSSLPMVTPLKEFINEPIKKFSENQLFTALSITNPHIVSFVDDLDTDQIKRIGYLANNTKEIFPKGVNANFVKILNQNSIFVRTYERGVGITKSCGTGMTASTISYVVNNTNLLDMPINIYNDGGMIKISVHKDNNNYSIDFIGNASYVFKSSVNYIDGNFTECMRIPYQKELDSYDEFLNTCKVL